MPTRLVLLLSGLSCAFIALALMLVLVFREPLAALFAVVAAAGAASESVTFWLVGRRKD